MRLHFDDRFDDDFAGRVMLRDSIDGSFDADLVLSQTMIHPHPRRQNMLWNSTGFGPFDKESNLYHVSSCLLLHQMCSSLKIITAIISSYKSSLKKTVIFWLYIHRSNMNYRELTREQEDYLEDNIHFEHEICSKWNWRYCRSDE